MALARHVTRHAIAQIVRPQQIAVTGEVVAVACFGDAGVVLLRPRSLEPFGQVVLDVQPSRPGIPSQRCPAGDVALAGGRLFIAQVFSDFVVVADASSGQIIERLSLGGEGRFAASLTEGSYISPTT